MSFLPALATWQFALAGMACASIPVLLHLLNRRRFRVVEWGAMQFLREAMQRNRRIMQVRDLLLMLLRAAAVLLFGLALARPFFTARHEPHDAGQPIHAVLLVDNSLSMGYQTLDGTLLDRAKQRAAAFIERLPVGSRISVLPLGGSEHGATLEPFDTKPFALEALQRVTLVDRSINFRQAVNEARRAAELVTDLGQRFVLLTDQQRANWADLAAIDQDPKLPAMQIVDVSNQEWDNTWVAELRIPDGVADAETPTTIQAILHHHGRDPRGDVRVALWVREQEVDSQLVSFGSTDETHEVTFEYTFRDAQPTASLPEFVPIKVALTADRLVEDDERFLLVPVVAVLPVVFVDQYGQDEDPARNRFGETRHLRHLLAPSTASGDAARQLIQVRHVQIGELDRDLLADARLVVIAGVEDPGEQVTLLREYLEQGGQLVIAAGAAFDPVAWDEAGWRDGNGILPLPLLPDLLGSLPESSAANLKPMSLSFESFGQHPYFHLAGNSEDDLRDLYAEPFFFQAVQVDASPAAVTAASQPPSAPTSPPEPGWLVWSPPEDGGSAEAPADVNSTPAKLKDQEPTDQEPIGNSIADQPPPAAIPRDLRPKILARLVSEAGPPFLIERPIGRGRVLFAASGLLSSWNTLPQTNAIIMFDRILRSMMQATVPARNYGGVERIAVPLPRDAREDRIVLSRPGIGALSESLDTGFLRTDQVGVTIDHPLTRGIYHLQSTGTQIPETEETEAASRWQLRLAVNGEEGESDLEPLPRASFERHAVVAEQVHWLAANDEISLAGAHVRGQDLWWWLALVVFLVLLLELAVIVWPMRVARPEP